MASLPLIKTIRHRLLLLALLPVVLVIPIVVAMAYWWSSAIDFRQLLMKANSDLSVAEETLVNTRQKYLLQLALYAESLNIRQRLDITPSQSNAYKLSLDDQLEQLRIETGLDYVRLLTPDGCQWQQLQTCSYPSSALLAEAREGRAQSAMSVFSAAQLQRLSPWLVERANIPLIATEHASPTQRQVENRGMVLEVAYPLQNNERKTQAIVVGGVLMNGNITFVDQIKATVYGEGSLLPGSLGTVTLFLDDVRISTNVPGHQDAYRRALGTRVSEEVKKKVLENGETWLDRAFVVSDWYVSAYKPITDVNNNRIGMLYSGFSEKPYQEAFSQWMYWLLLFFTAILLATGVWAVISARGIFRPVEAMVAVIGRIRMGERLRMKDVKSARELNVLALEFNQMLDQLELQHDHIQQAAEQLELKVVARTEDLQQHIQLLQSTREQLVVKGKLAAIGELTAGIAHEINNPTAVILGYLDLMMTELGEAGKQVEPEAQLIIQQVDRIRNIINNLLQYSRTELHHTPENPLNINQLIKDTQPLVRHDLNKNNVQLRLHLGQVREVQGHKQQLQQVLINLIMNAINAMPEGGRLSLKTCNWGDNGVLLIVKDTGKGMAEDILARIFDPFYSQTQGGTGLGLSVSYSILQRFQAEISVRSRVGHGARFFILLKAINH